MELKLPQQFPKIVLSPNNKSEDVYNFLLRDWQQGATIDKLNLYVGIFLMAFKKSQSMRLAPQPVRHWFYRASLVMLATSAAALMVMSKSGNPSVNNMRITIIDAVTPVLAVAASPMDSIANGGKWVAELASLRADNIALKNQNVQLLQWQAIAKEMEQENKSLRALLNVVPDRKKNYITARIVSDLGGPYVHAALINGGTLAGISKDQAVISDSGLVGRVVEAGEKSARVILLNDINSRVPVIGEKSREKGILSGNNNDLPSLTYLSADSKILVGERLVTSGDGGVFPPGIPVGMVTEIDKGVVSVQTFVEPGSLQYISVVDYAK